MKNKLIVFIFLLITCFSVDAQERECGMESHMTEMMKDPDFAREWELNQNKFKSAVKQSLNTSFRQNLLNPIVIPVAVHFPEAEESDRACLEALAQNQIDILNGDFTATNPDANLWPDASGFYPGVNHGAADIQFCIATAFHPEDTDEDLVEGGPAVTIGYDFGGGNDADSNWSGYMNFLVKDIGGGLLGYSPLGGSINAGQSVVINLGAFGSGAGCPDSGIVPNAPYNLGRTVTHELGHFYQLEHPFSGSCDSDDGVADTPNIVDANYGCPAPGTIDGCETGEFALTMSYMDYGDDACLYMFSEGQTDIVDIYVSEVLQAQFKPGTVPVCVEVPQYVMSDDTVTTCNGLFYDSGGAEDGPAGNYSNNEIFTFTICPETEGQSTQLNFTEFATQNNADIMSIYNASDATDPATLIGEYSGTNGPTDPVIASLTNPTGCLTVVFTSTGAITDAGWLAFISCVDPPAECQDIIAQLDTTSPGVDSEDVILVCPGEEITLSGSGQFSEPGGGVGAAYIWDIGDGTSISGQTVTFSFDEPGVYIANLNIWDTNTSVFPEGCKNDNRINQYIQVSTTPVFEATDETVNPICYGDSSTIIPLITPTPYINECTVPESNVTFLPDGNGAQYQTCIVVDCFEEGQTLEFMSQLQDICLNIEHSYLGDLDILITSPSGQEVYLHQYPSGFGTYLGSPIDNDANVDPGEGADYCFSMDAATLLVDGPVVGGSIQAGSYLPVETFAQLEGSQLNGNWCITITDNIPSDNGYLFNWTLNFDTSIVPTSLSFTPEIVSGYWEGDEPTIDEVNGDILTVTPDSDGQFCYTYTALDNFGCEYSDEICIEVLPELVHDLPTDLFICDPVSSDAIFNLSPNEATVLNPNPNPDNFVVTFHNSVEDAENDIDPITNPSSYIGLDEEVVFLRFEYLDSNCFEIETFQLLLLDAPEVFLTDDLVLCDDISNDEVEAFDLEQQTVEVLGTQSASDYTVTYHTNGDDADLGVNSISSPYNNISNPQPIYIRIQSLVGAGCYVATKDPVFNLIVTNQAEAIAPDDLTLCDASSTGNLEASFDLDQQTPAILGDQDPTTFTVTYYSSQADADSGDLPLTSPFLSSAQTIYVRVEEAGVPNCYGTTEFNLIVNSLPFTIEMTPLSICADDTNGFASFNLTDKDTEAINGQDDLVVSYHDSEADADSGSNALLSPYTNTVQDAQTIFIRLENINTLCFNTMPLDLGVGPLPIPVTPPLQTVCDDDFDGFASFDFTGIDLVVLGDQTAMDVSYHLSEADADTGENALASPFTNTEANTQTIFIRLETISTGCYATTTLDLEVFPLPVVPVIADYILCDNTGLGDLQEQFDLSTKDLEIIDGQNSSVAYYESQSDADAGINALANTYQNTSSPQVLFVSLTDLTTACVSTGSFTLIVNPLPSLQLPTPLEVCDDGTPDGLTQIDLTTKDDEIRGGNPDYSISYYLNQLDADLGTNPLPGLYTNISNPQTVFVRGENIITGCVSTTTLDLGVGPLPIPATPPLQTVCDDDFDGFASFDFTGIDLVVLGDQTAMDVSYHLSEADADTGENALASPFTNTEANTQTIFIRLETISTGCYATTTLDLEVFPLPVVPVIADYILCDNTGLGDLQEQFDLSTKDLEIIDGQNSSVAYYESQSDADAGINALANTYQNTSSPQVLFVSLTDLTTACVSTGSFTLIVNPLPSLQLPTPLEVCDDGTPDGLTQIDLTVKNEEIRGGNPDYSISYYLNQLDADSGTNPLPGLYTNISNPQTVFVRGENIITGCVSTTTLELGVIQAAVANTPPPMEFCDPDNDGYGEFVLTDSDDLITGSAPGVTVTYHETLSDANTGANPLASPYNNVVIDTQTIYARVESATVVTDCATIIDLVLNVYPTPQLVTPTALELCDDNLDQVVQFDLSDSVTELLNGIELSDVVISYYETEANASSSNNAISTPMAYSNISNPQTVWIRVEYPETGCEKLSSLELIVNPLPVIAQPTPLAICDDLLADAFTAFDLTVKNTEITLGDGSLEVVYYTSLLDAESAINAILDPTSYTNEAIDGAAPNPQTLHVRVTDLDTGCYDLTTLTIRVLPNPTPSPDPVDLELCDEISSGDGLEVFDLTIDEVFILNGELGVSASYYETLQDAEAGENAIATPEVYTNIETPSQLIYVRVTNDLTGCYTLVDFNIIVHPLPVANVVSDLIACELDTDDVFDFDLEEQTALILGGQDPSIFEVTYHTSLVDAETGLNFLGSPYTNISDPEVIFVSVVNTETGCRNTQLEFTLEVHEAAQAFAPLEFYILCDDNVETDGDPSNDSVEFDLSVQDVFVLDGQDPLNYTVSYYATQADADQGINALPTLYQNTVNPQVIIARVDNDIEVLDATGTLVDSSICYATALLTLNVDPLPIVLIDMDYILCVDTNGTEVLAPLEIETGLSSDDYTFIWSDATGAVVGTGSSYAPSQGGTYSLEVFDATLQTQCAAPVEVFTVIESTPPILTAQVTTAAFASTHVIEALATGQGVYEYSLDQGPWGDSGVFVDVTPGEHVVTARDLNGCGETQAVVYVIDYPLYFTPNGDGYNDTWNIVGVANQNNAKILIFDRFGKLLKQISPSGEGWDGTYNGASLPSSDYWFTLDYTDPTTGNPQVLRAHFSLKR